MVKAAFLLSLMAIAANASNIKNENGFLETREADCWANCAGAPGDCHMKAVCFAHCQVDLLGFSRGRREVDCFDYCAKRHGCNSHECSDGLKKAAVCFCHCQVEKLGFSQITSQSASKV